MHLGSDRRRPGIPHRAGARKPARHPMSREMTRSMPFSSARKYQLVWKITPIPSCRNIRMRDPVHRLTGACISGTKMNEDAKKANALGAIHGSICISCKRAPRPECDFTVGAPRHSRRRTRRSDRPRRQLSRPRSPDRRRDRQHSNLPQPVRAFSCPSRMVVQQKLPKTAMSRPSPGAAWRKDSVVSRPSLSMRRHDPGARGHCARRFLPCL